MDRDALEALNRAALIELIVQLQARLAGVEAELARLRQPPKTPENLLVPPARGFKPNPMERRRAKRGARRGHLASSRLQQDRTWWCAAVRRPVAAAGPPSEPWRACHRSTRPFWPREQVPERF